MDTLAEIQQLKSELNSWFEWVVHEEDILNRATEDYTKELLKVRLNSGYKLLLGVEQEYNAKVAAYNAAVEDVKDGELEAA